ncbi:histidine phosphatase superfamily [Rhexocercosporidium sp. MPI-PUGE-AT-0058]|nr:histidine phosphatase superfamily [Rhexocercosporidium sp. MPI-PUGE-AT-0058]
MLEAALAVVAASTSSFARLGPSAPSQQPISASPLRGITIHLVRHAERPHNLRSIPEKERIDMLDPGLTEYGLAQCVLLSERFHAMDKVTKILASPLCRTLHTALVAFKPAIERGIQVVLYPDLRECGGGRCNTGTNIEDLLKDLFEIEEDIQKDCVDASLCEPGWETGTESLEKKDMRIQRAERVLSMLYHLGKMSANASDYDVEIVVVTHSRLILLLEGHTSGKFFLMSLDLFWIMAGFYLFGS